MPRKFILLISVIILMLAACAKRTTESQEPETLSLVWQIPVVGNPLDIDVDNTNIYVAQDQGGISIINQANYVSNWITKVTASDGSQISLGRIKKIAVVPEHNRILLVETNNTDRITILNSSDTDTLEYIFDIIGGTSGIKAIDGISLGAPGIDFPMAITYCTDSNFKYDRYDGTIFSENVYSISNPTTASGFYMGENEIYVTAEQRGLFIYNRASRQYLGEIALPGEAQKVEVSGNYAYVASRQAGLHVVDISDPTAPVLVASYNTSGYATTVDILGTKAAVSSGSGGVYLFDISVPASFYLLQRLDSIGTTNNAKLYGNKLAVASRDHGILIYEID